jgi:prophage DNA circulation protein
MKNEFLSKLPKAAWRNVAFHIHSDDAEFGRNVVVHEFVQRDKPFVEDVGRKTRRFHFEAWIAASADNNFDPWPQRDAFIEAVERGGMGDLVHPFFGTMQGHVPSAKVKQSSSQNGGLIVLSCEFIEAGEREFKTAVLSDTQGRVTSAAFDAAAAAVTEVDLLYSTQDVQGFVADDAQAMIGQFTGTLAQQGQLDGLASQTGLQTLREFTPAMRGRDIATAIIDIFLGVLDPTAFFNFDRPPVPPIDTRSRNVQRQNQAAFVHLVRVLALTEHTARAASLGAASDRYTADSVALRDTPALITRAEMERQRRAVTVNIMDEVDALSALNIYPDTQSALLALRTDAVLHMTAEGEHLARTFETVCCDGTGWWVNMPAIVLAYRHYGLLNDDVIIERNQVPHPLFISPAARVELLAGLTV